MVGMPGYPVPGPRMWSLEETSGRRQHVEPEDAVAARSEVDFEPRVLSRRGREEVGVSMCVKQRKRRRGPDTVRVCGSSKGRKEGGDVRPGVTIQGGAVCLVHTVPR
jgi:hypothetical protein